MNKGLRYIFRKWILIFVAGGVLLTLAGSWWIHSRVARDAALNLMRIKLDDAQQQVQHTLNNLNTITKLSDDAALSSAHILARIIAANPAVLKDPATLEKIRKDLDVNELHVSDEHGILIASIPSSAVGYNMGSSKQSSPFLEALTNPDFEMVQALMPNGSRNKIVSYAGVARLDKPGIVQIGYYSDFIEKERQLADVQYIATSFRIGQQGTLRITDSATCPVQTECVFSDTVQGRPCLCLSVPCGAYVLTGSLPESEIYSSRNEVMLIILLATLILFANIYLQVSLLLKRVVINGIDSVNTSLEQITEGDLEETVSVRNSSEFEELSEGINATVSALRRSIESESKRINADLEMAYKIQNSVLPVGWYLHEHYRLAAVMRAAKEVGGDFYDYFAINEHQVAMIVADVAGKGLTAALYMMGAKALLKELLVWGLEPSEAVTRANVELCRNNEANMFLTAFVAVLNVDSGVLTCVNAGHNPPLLKHPNSSWAYLNIKHSIALGITDRAKYNSVPVPLTPGDKLFLYTDGVTEARNAQNELFGEQRLLHELSVQELSPTARIEKLQERLSNFASGVPQSDDITMLAFDFVSQD